MNFVKKSLLIASLVGFAGAAFAQTAGYNNNSAGSATKSGFGLCWRTGFWTPAMATSECDSDLVTKAPEPTPPVAQTPTTPEVQTPPPPPPVKSVTLNAKGLFDFDKAVLRPEGKAQLDGLAAKLGSINYETVVAVGYADRFGSADYNQKLSERRAEAAKNYLASKGVDPNRIFTEGKGSSNPVSDAAQCKGAKSAKVISCLQADRRVEVEVTGTQR